MSFSINGKTAIVTGAANGIGLAIARQFADRGANVMCADMDEKKLAEEWGDKRDEGNLRYFAGDLRQRLTIANLISATIDCFDRVDILINASRQVMETDALNADDTSVSVLLEQNLMTALHLTQQVAKRMIKQGADQDEGQLGSIVNLSSIAARHTHPELMGYSIASAALEQMTRSMALALAPERIRVNAVAPGWIETEMTEGLREDPARTEAIMARTPMQRWGQPSEVGALVRWLLSEEASFVTGAIYPVDGGYLAI